MKIRNYTKIIFGVLIVSSVWIGFSLTHNLSLSEEQAFLKVFNNYDKTNKLSIWKDMKFPINEVEDGYWDKKIGIVKSIFFEPYYENGKKKVFLLTKTIPKDISFDCHACVPLIGATTFALDKGDWIVESQNQFLMWAGEYGESYVVKLVEVGPNKFGLSIEFKHMGNGFYKDMALLIPYNKKIENSHQETIYYENFNDCGGSLQCVAFTAKFEFDHSKSDNFYELKIRRFGTEMDKKENNKAVPVDAKVTYKLINGKYTVVNKRGEGVSTSSLK